MLDVTETDWWLGAHCTRWRQGQACGANGKKAAMERGCSEDAAVPSILHASTHFYMHACTHVHTHAYTHVYTHVYIHAHVCTGVQTHAHVHTHANTHGHMHGPYSMSKARPKEI